jgi:alpha 1,3-glucosidase
MLQQLDANGRKLVAIIDPHIKNEGGYKVVEELKKKDLAVHNKDGNIYEGWCWPGSSHWVDAFNPAVQKWWKGLMDKFAAPNMHIWNDMNEPSVFNGPETTMPKDNLHYDGWEHRDLHNLNGMTFHNVTYEALKSRGRPFVLTRSFFAGSQRLGAMWTGDNQADWTHLKASVPMILSMGVAGFPFAGADVGGFFGNPSQDLLVRWYQAGAFYPFFRGHAHIDTRRREPYLLEHRDLVNQAIRLRYSLLPAWYTAFWRANQAGTPIVRPMFYEYPEDSETFALDEQFIFEGILVKPVTDEAATSVKVYLPEGVWYDYHTFEKVKSGWRDVKVALGDIPMYIRGGSVIVRKDRVRRSSALMKEDPYTVLVAADEDGAASGELYTDDGVVTFMFDKGTLKVDGKAKIEKIVVLGWEADITVEGREAEVRKAVDRTELKVRHT